MPTNRIRQLETRPLRGPQGDVSVIFCALDVDDPGAADAFVAEVVEQVQLQRMASPPDTSMMLVTLIGALDATRFAQLWQQHLAAAPALAAFMEMMVKADVLHGTSDGKVLDQASLI